jgi:5,10-methylenetetrahydrofolate reductase
MTADSWDSWLSEATNAYGIRCLSLVGAPSTRNSPVSLSLPQSLRLAAAHPGHFTLGGVCIAERHSEERSESKRMLQKAEDGCSFFISQAVYHPGSTIRMLRDYQADCQRLGVQPRRVILTFTPCGRPKTLEFIKWLGVHISPETEDAILSADDPLRKSIQICCDTLRQIVQQDYNTTIPLGLNIESVSINKQEIDGSIELFHALTEVLEHHSRRL